MIVHDQSASFTPDRWFSPDPFRGFTRIMADGSWPVSARIHPGDSPIGSGYHVRRPVVRPERFGSGLAPMKKDYRNHTTLDPKKVIFAVPKAEFF